MSVNVIRRGGWKIYVKSVLFLQLSVKSFQNKKCFKFTFLLKGEGGKRETVQSQKTMK